MAEHLVCIVDVDPVGWAARKADLMGTLFQQLFFALHAWRRLSTSHTLAVVAATRAESRLLYPPPGANPSEVGYFDDVKRTVLKSAMELIKSHPDSERRGGGGRKGIRLASAVSMSLCYINRVRRTAVGVEPPSGRILVLQGTPDEPADYIAMMNLTFACRRLGVVVDTCMVAPCQSAFLKQAAHVTKGTYLRVLELDTLAHHLLTVSLRPMEVRTSLPMPLPPTGEGNVRCFCHKKPLSMGYACSVCLSVFCEEALQCSTCGADFVTIKKEEE